MDQLLKRLIDLSPEKRRLLLSELQKNGAIPPLYLLSFAQQRLWFLHQWEANNPFYHTPTVLRMKGHLHLNALERSLQEIMRRHASLRTAFVSLEGQPVQVIIPGESVNISLLVIDLTGLQMTERQDILLPLIQEEIRVPFDLAVAPLLRCRLVSVSEDDHLLLMTMHHIITDGWSLNVFFHELSQLYEASVHQYAATLPEPVLQYQDFALWQRKWLQGPVLEREIIYWRQQLQGAPLNVEFLTDRPRSRVLDPRAATHVFVLSKHLTAALRVLSHREKATLYMTLLTAFTILLYRYTEQRDLVVGSPIANRTRAELEGIIGFFVNTLVLRTRLSDQQRFVELLHDVREVVLDAYTHQEMPFEKLVEEMHPERDPVIHPLFQVMFTLQEAASAYLTLSGVNIEPMRFESETTPFDLALTITDQREHLEGEFEYSTALFDASTVKRMATHFQVLLESIVTNPEQPLEDLLLITSSEQRQILLEWNRAKADSSSETCIHHLIEQQVEQAPDAIAIVHGQTYISYRELNRRANQLAHYLESLDIKSEDRVGICDERSIEMVVALLSILKVGAAYVPLDPTYPRERLAFMLADTQISLLLTQEKLLPQLPECEMLVTCLDRDWHSIALFAGENLQGKLSSENLAYVLYTSGSTGLPKGVLIRHQGLTNFCVAITQHYEFNCNDRVLQLASFSFDLAIEEIFPSLLKGATIVMWLDWAPPSLTDFHHFLECEGLTVIDIPAAYWHAWVSELEHTRNPVPDSVRLMIAGGERVLLEKLITWKSLVGDHIRWSNAYGPTETTVTSMTYEATFTHRNQPLYVLPIGRPITNTQIYVLDQHLRLVPIGLAGDLYIGGKGLARGYLNQPALTAEKFIPHPFSSEPGARLYKTGDRARYLSDGNIEFLGRIDQQVKLRGFRIELTEIETILRQYPSVKEALVVMREDVPGDKRLVAYIILKPHVSKISSLFRELDTQAPNPVNGQEASEETHRVIRNYLRKQLPEYMIPSVFLFLEALPLTSNGKIDYRALPAPENTKQRETKIVTYPHTPTEELLNSIWASVLGMEYIDRNHNFFEMGGHSLLAVQIISRIRTLLQVDIPLRTLFEFPTVAELANRIEEVRQEASYQLNLAIQPVSRKTTLLLSYAQQRLWFLDQWMPNTSLYNIPLILRLTGPLNIETFEQAMLELLRRHEALRTIFATEDWQPIQVIIPANQVYTDHLIVDISALPQAQREQEALRLANEEALQPFNLSRGPLVRNMLLRLEEHEHQWLLTIHHIIADDWSVRIFVEDLLALYEGFLIGMPPILPELPVQYADFANWQRQWLQGSVLEQQLNFWKQNLDGAPSVLELPIDHPRPLLQTYEGAVQFLQLPPQLTEALRHLSRREECTLFMTLLAAFSVLLARYCGEEDIVVGSPIANRGLLEIEKVIGFFLNTLIFRIDLSDNPSFRDLLHRVRNIALEAYAHQDVPFEKLVEELHSKRSLSHSPLFQVLFILQPLSVPDLHIGNLTVTLDDRENKTAKFDLTLSIKENTTDLTASLIYNTVLFNETPIAHMLQHFQQLLKGIVTDSEQRMSTLPLLTCSEQEQMLITWNATTSTLPQKVCFHRIFEAQVERTPDVVALVCEEEQITYALLNKQANRLAFHLKTLGVEAETLVTLLAERGSNFVIAMLAIFKAGGAFLPLDPKHPVKRHMQIISQSRSPLALVTGTYEHTLKDTLMMLNAPELPLIVNIETLVHQATLEPDISSHSLPESLAYVMYTSGSTGTPKGVMVEQIGMVNHIEAKIKDLGLTSNDIVAQIGPPCFDIVIWQCLAALTVGGRICIFKDEIVYHPTHLLEHVEHMAITTLQMVPSMLRVLIGEIEFQASERFSLSNLRWIIPTGEALPTDLCLQWLNLYPEIPLLNTYGSTECSDDQCHYAILSPISDYSSPIVPLGWPIQNMRTYILDRHLMPVPIGVIGEIYIGGIGVGRGYLYDPERTANVFIPDLFAQEPGARLYRTGDRARYLTDGRIEFLGRSDHLVKIRGVRVELGEIEAALMQHPAVREVVVVMQEATNKDHYLVAYIVNAQSQEATSEDLRAALREKLPEAMLPSMFVFIDAIPLNANGKLDRRALPHADNLPSQSNVDYVGPSTDLELLIARVWQEVLRIEQIGIHNNFFDLGGNSLLIAQVQMRLQEALNQELSLIDLFQFPTIASLAKYASQNYPEVDTFQEVDERARKRRQASLRRKK